MNKVNYVLGAYPDDVQMNRTQSAAEELIENVAQIACGCGVYSGLSTSIEGNNLSISPGVGFDSLGRKLSLADEGMLDLNQIERPAVGNVKYVSVIAKHIKKTYGETFDISGVQSDLFLDDDVEIIFLEGVEQLANIAVKPSVGTSLVLCDFLIDTAIAHSDIAFDFNRRVSLKPFSESILTRSVSLKSLGETTITFEELNIPSGSYKIFAQILGSNNVPTTVLLESTNSGLKLYLSHVSKDAVVRQGTPLIVVGSEKISSFTIGGNTLVNIDLLFKLEG